MDRDWLYFALVALGAGIVFALFRRGSYGRTRVVLIACAVAVGITYFILFRMLDRSL
ncbi:MAG: hypothetical protein RIM33_09585 [Alphaproteobacteria bacterium]